MRSGRGVRGSRRHAEPPHAPLTLRCLPGQDRVAVLRVRRPRPRRRTRHRRGDDLVLRDQHPRHPRLRPPLAGHPEPRRHLHRRLDDGGAGRRTDRRAPMPRRLDRRQRRRPRTRHPLRALVAHGSRDRRSATRARRHRERPRPALRTRHSPHPGRSNPRCTQPRRCNRRACNRGSQPRTQPVAAGRRANATSSGARSRTRGSGRPPPNCAMDRPTGVTGRRTTSPVPDLHHRRSPRRCSGRLWPRIPRAAASPRPGTGTPGHDRPESPSDRPGSARAT